MSAVLDQDVVEELLSITDGDPDLLLDLIGMFLEDAPSKLETIQSSLASGDYETLAKSAHQLKGSAGNLGAHLVLHDCDELQSVESNRDESKARLLVPDLEEHLADAIDALTELRGHYQ